MIDRPWPSGRGVGEHGMQKVFAGVQVGPSFSTSEHQAYLHTCEYFLHPTVSQSVLVYGVNAWKSYAAC
ncbi:Intracellular endo-alpha-(1-_5)-L-arabinanase [Fusarium oxysporum f. sp. albedinis]|nr:Intracellular endo-alpha-(1->5)-L-arabinanase [Fusarium oxysporum f. sp. albedinis]